VHVEIAKRERRRQMDIVVVDNHDAPGGAMRAVHGRHHLLIEKHQIVVIVFDKIERRTQ